MVIVSLNFSSYTAKTDKSKISFKKVLITLICNTIVHTVHSVTVLSSVYTMYTLHFIFNAYIQTPSLKNKHTNKKPNNNRILLASA